MLKKSAGFVLASFSILNIALRLCFGAFIAAALLAGFLSILLPNLVHSTESSSISLASAALTYTQPTTHRSHKNHTLQVDNPLRGESARKGNKKTEAEAGPESFVVYD